jgi:hypothetical protein
MVRSEVPRQRPDRVWGLRRTKAFEKYLPSNSDPITSSPFSDFVDPVLFPFLILEAKRERYSEGFEEMEMQTALPIWRLLQLQESLHFKTSQDSSALVWFFASRGDLWRVYGCYSSSNGNEVKTSKYVSSLPITIELLHQS